MALSGSTGFAANGGSAVASLGLDAVADVLAYHVSPGRRTAADIVPARRAGAAPSA